MSREYHERVRIDHKKPETPDIVTLTLAADMPDAKPGQFLMVWVPEAGERPISLSSDSPIELTVRKAGKVTERLFQMRTGDEIYIRGPYGRPFPVYDGKPAYLVGGGCGVAPLRFLSKRLPREFQTLLIGAESMMDVLCRNEFIDEFDERFYASTIDGSFGIPGNVTDLFDVVKIEPNSNFYICGPEKMMEAAAQRAAAYTSPENIYLSLERYMKCGRGLCGSCEIDGYRSCVDGPVFSYDQLIGGDFGTCKREKSGKRVEI